MNHGIHLTERAIQHVQRQLDKHGRAQGLRLGVKASGCSGWSYVVDWVEQPKNDDQVFEQGGIKLFVDNDSLPLLLGMELDFVREGLNESFQFNNPNATAACGCGESFTVS